MIVQALKVILDEAELTARLKEALGGVSQIKDVTVGLAAGAVKIGGKFQAGLSIPFETRWSVEVLDAGLRLGVRLADVSVGFFGVSAATVSAQVMGALSQRLRGVAGVAVEGELIKLEPGVLLASRGVRLEGAVRRLAISPGGVELEVGA
jgi:hypothetical protein